MTATIINYTIFRYALIESVSDGFKLIYDLDGVRSPHPTTFKSVADIEEFINRFRKAGDSDYYTQCGENIFRRDRLPNCAVQVRNCSHWCVVHDQCQWTD